MKNFPFSNLVKIALTFSLALIIFVFSPLVEAGRESGGGGGNGAVLEFNDLARSMARALDTHQDFRIGGFALAREFEEVIQTASIIGTHEQLELDGVSVSAINYPAQDKIVLNFEDWTALSVRTKKQLTAHELIGLKFRGRLDDSTYQYSDEILKLLEDFTIEAAALGVAQAGSTTASKMEIITSRTKTLKNRNNGMEERRTTEVAIRTFENNSDSSIRVYHAESGTFQGVISISLDHFEGKGGGYLKGQ